MNAEPLRVERVAQAYPDLLLLAAFKKHGLFVKADLCGAAQRLMFTGRRRVVVVAG